jgi:uncharacterized SAM-binding protein YcdF (DUF218 family)
MICAGAWRYLCATPAFVEWIGKGLESPYRYAPASAHPVADAIVVFVGDAMPDPKRNWQKEADKISQNRLGFAYRLYHTCPAPIRAGPWPCGSFITSQNSHGQQPHQQAENVLKPGRRTTRALA